MKVMKKFWTIICSFAFVVAVGLGVTLNVDIKAQAATSNKMSVAFGALQFKDGATFQEPEKYALVLDSGLSTPESYDDFTVCLDGQEVPAYTVAGHGIIYIPYEAFPSEIGDVFLLTIPAGTYYQSDACTSNDYNLFLKNVGKGAETDTQYTVYNSDTTTQYTLLNGAPYYDFDLNMVDWALSASNSTGVYLAIDDNGEISYGGDGSNENWDVSYNSLGNAVKVNGELIETGITKTHASMKAYLPILDVANAGDVLTIEGWFKNDTHGAFYLNEKTFVFDGQMWENTDTVSYDLDASQTTDADPQNGFYASMAANDIPVGTANNGWEYTTKPCGEGRILLNGEALEGACLNKFSVGDWYVNISASETTAQAGDVVTVGGWFYCEANSSTTFIKINPTTFTFDGTTWTKNALNIDVLQKGELVADQYIYVMPGESTDVITASATGDMLTDTTVTTVYDVGAVQDGKFVLREGESTSEYLVTFSVKDKHNTVYRKEMIVCVGFEDFVMENGAAVRVEDNTNAANGLRFIAEMGENTYSNLKEQNATFGMVIVPRDYITEGYELTAENLFGANAKYSATAESGATQEVRLMLLLDGLTPVDHDNDGKYEIRGAITDIIINNITREFVGVAYVYVNDMYFVASYYDNEMDNNARSMYYVSQKAIEKGDHAEAVQAAYIDEFQEYLDGLGKTYNVKYTVNYIKRVQGKNIVETETKTSKLNDKVVVEAEDYGADYQLTSPDSITAILYANKPNVFNFYYKDASAVPYDSVAWYHPALDSSNGYDNETNDAIAQKMLAAGFTTVNLAGSSTPMLNNDTNIEAVKQIINMFYRNGLKTVAYTHNAGSSGTTSEMFGLEYLPDFYECDSACGNCGLCDGFAGFIVWDEPMPTAAAMDRLVDYANWYVAAYGDAEDVKFMVNLFPSYSDTFSSGDYTSYSAYIEAYCETVLSVIGDAGLEKYLSMDSYPIMADGTLRANFLYDMAVLKHYAEVYDAHAHSVLQVCGWEGEQNVAPTEAEMRMMMYSALAFGMDSISWWGYDEVSGAIVSDQSPNGSDTVYNAITNVNQELANFGTIYKTYNDWKGVIMSSPAKGTSIFGYYINQDPQYNAFNMVKSDSLLSGYILSASDTQSFSAISGSGSNHIVGVMQDANGNEAYAVVNYAALEDDQTLKLTFTPKAAGDYVIYTKDGSQTVTMNTSGYTLTLEPGQGAFIISASTKHTVTFKNWDGTVLSELTGVTYGTTPVFDGQEPTRDGYKFTNWSPAIGAITGDTVYTAQFAKISTVTFYVENEEYKTVECVTGELLETPATPTLDGYVFKAWTLNGEVYDFSKQVMEDFTLQASWLKVVEDGEKSVILTAEEVSAQTTNATLTNEGVAANETWYYDSDYTDTGVTEGSLLEYIVKYETSTAGTHTIVLPKIDYTLYKKVDFGYRADGAVSNVTFGGAAVTHSINRTVSIRTDENGTKAYVYTTNDATVVATIDLADSVATGAEGLEISFTASGYFWVKITQFHGTLRVVDYQAEMANILTQLPDSADGLTGSEQENALIAQYLQYAEYMTDSEKAKYSEPEVITASKQRTVTFVNVDGTAAEYTQQLEAGSTITETPAANIDGYAFKAWTLNGEVYDFSTPVTENITLVATWNKLISNAEKSVILTAEEVSAQTTNATLTNEGIELNETWYYDSDYTDTGVTEGSLLEYIVTYSTSTAGTHTIVLPKINYTMYKKVDFGYRADGGISNVTFGGVSVTHNINRTVSIRTDENGTKAYVYTTNDATVVTTIDLADSVATGAEGLEISFTASGYFWVKITQFHGTLRVVDYQAEMAAAVGKLPANSAEFTGSDEEFNTVLEYLNYRKYMTAYEQSNYSEHSLITAWKEAHGGNRAILTNVTASIKTNGSYESGNNQIVMSGASDNVYTFTLPTVDYSLYSSTSIITMFGGANNDNYSFSAYGTAFTNINNGWNWVKVVTAGSEGYTDGYGVNHGAGSFLIIGSTDFGTEWLTCVKLPDAVANGEEGLAFTVTTAGNWDWVKIRNASAEEATMLGSL